MHTSAVTAAPFSNEFIAKIKTALVEEKTNLEHELGKSGSKNPANATDVTSAFPNYGDKDDENAAEVADYEANLSLEQTLEKSLRDVDTALSRIQSNQYGICKYCQKPIDERRLLARPTSSSCVECKKAITQEA